MSVVHGDCLAVMATMDAESIHAIVTDPPYGLGFMGKHWDHGMPGADFWREMLRIAKPGAYLLAFGGTRTYHRLACAIEDAGWEIRDCLVWAYASGFPKSLDVSKAIDKAAGAERPVVRERNWHDPMNKPFRKHYGGDGPEGQPVVNATAPATPEAAEWQGWGTALKPAWEPIVMARKPLRGTVAANVQRYGTGALNIDGCRIGTKPPARWPANVILTDPIFDGDVPGVVGGGEVGPSFRPGDRAVYTDDRRRAYGDYPDREDGWSQKGAGYGDSGTYSRFFLVPKAARSDREPVLGGNGNGSANVHPTVKPTELMRHLVRLVTPPGGTVLDPFLGSGSTALVAEMEGFAWVGIEKEAEYVAIAEARLNGTQRGMGL
jgi:site-specific DNA-methyltransferase (adenine-specific)